MEKYFEDIKHIKHRESGIQWNRSFDIKMSHASSPLESSATLGWLSETDKVTEPKAPGPPHLRLDFFIQLVLEKSKNWKFKIWHFRAKMGRESLKC
jgi:hypothetical protein